MRRQRTTLLRRHRNKPPSRNKAACWRKGKNSRAESCRFWSEPCPYRTSLPAGRKLTTMSYGRTPALEEIFSHIPPNEGYLDMAHCNGPLRAHRAAHIDDLGDVPKDEYKCPEKGCASRSIALRSPLPWCPWRRRWMGLWNRHQGEQALSTACGKWKRRPPPL
jgi:hypothetical protein